MFYSSVRVTEPSGLLPLKMKLIPAWWMIDQWSDRSSFQLWILRIPRGQRKWSSLTLSPLGTCLCSDGLWVMAACGYWCLTVSWFWFGFRMAALGLGPARPRQAVAGLRHQPWIMWTTEPEVTAYCESRSPSPTHIFQYLAPFLCRLSKYSVWMMLLFPLFCSQCVNAQQPRSFDRSDSVCRGQVFQLCLLIMSRGPDIWVLSDSVGSSQDFFWHLFLN